MYIQTDDKTMLRKLIIILVLSCIPLTAPIGLIMSINERKKAIRGGYYYGKNDDRIHFITKAGIIVGICSCIVLVLFIACFAFYIYGQSLASHIMANFKIIRRPPFINN